MDAGTEKMVVVLQYTYGLVPIVAGVDKFTNFLAQWGQYVGNGIADMLPFEVSTFMAIVGVVEIIAGVLVFIKPRVGAYVVMGWLMAIALSLLISGHYIDVAVRDIVMAIGAFVLATLSKHTRTKE